MAQAGLLALEQRLFADEVALAEFDEAPQAGFQGAVFNGQFPGDEAVRLLQAHGLHGAGAEGLDAVGLPLVHQQVEEAVLHLYGVVELPAEFAHKVHPEGVRLGRAQAQGLAGQPLEAVLAQIRVGERLQQVAGFGPRHYQHALLRGDLLQLHAAVCGQEPAEAVKVMAVKGAAGDQVVVLRPPLVEGELAAHAAGLGEQVAEGQAPDAFRRLVGQQGVQPGGGARAPHLELGEMAHVQQADGLRHMAALGADMLEVVAAAEGVLLHNGPAVARQGVVPVQQGVRLLQIRFGEGIALRGEPVGPLPAIDAAEDRPQRLQPVVAGGSAQGAARGPLLVRVVDGEHIGIGFLCLGAQVAAAGIGAEAPRVNAHHVHCGLALRYPLRQLPAGAAGGGHAKAVPLVQPEVGQAPGWAHQRAAVRRVGDGAIVDGLDAHLAEGRDALDAGLHMRHEPLQVGIEELVFGARVRAIHIAAGGAGFVGAQNQAAVLLPHIPGGIGFAQHALLRQALLLAGEDVRVRLGDDVLVLHRHHRQIQPHHRACPAGEAAGAGDDMLAADVALVGAHQPLALLAGEAGDARVAVDGGAPAAGAGGKRLGQVGWLYVAVLWVLYGAHQALCVAEGPKFLHLRRGEEPDRHAHCLGHAGIVAVFVHAVLAAGEANVGHLAEAHLLASLLLQALVEVHRILVQLAHRVAHVEERQEAGRMPGGAGGELPALHQRRIPALARQVVERAHPHNAAAHHHRLRPLLHLRPQVPAKPLV